MYVLWEFWKKKRKEKIFEESLMKFIDLEVQETQTPSRKNRESHKKP